MAWSIVAGVWLPCYIDTYIVAFHPRAHLPMIHATNHVHLDHEKEFHGFRFLFMHVVLLIQVWSSAKTDLSTLTV